MADPTDPLGATLSLSAAARHDRLCDRFEAGLRGGPPLPMEDLLAEVPESERPGLFAALVRVARECQQPPPNPEEYRARFPQFDRLIVHLFAAPADQDSDLFSPAPARWPEVPGYELLSQLGEGGMGVVYLARHTTLRRLVAVKTVRGGGWVRPGDVLRFELEARAVAGLDHANVVRLYDFGQHDGVPYYVMEYVDGGALSRRLAGPGDPTAAAALVETLARAAQYVHDNNLVHRDLKPANVLLTSDGTPKLADFGLAKRLAGDDPQLTKSWAVLGTPCYMAPEQAGRASQVGPRADVYALGAILYEMLTGRPPFRADTYEQTIAQVLTEEPSRPADLVPAVPAELEAVCLACLEKNPDNRYPTAAALADDLKRFREGEPVSVRPLHALDLDAKWARKVGYELLDQLGSGRGVFVYLARQTNINRLVVLKLAADPGGDALRREAEVLAGLAHPHVLRMYDYVESQKKTYLVLEYVEGGVSLGRRLRGPDGAGRPLDPSSSAEVARQVALAVQAVHDRGFLHCGLRPSEVILTPADGAKLGGFWGARRAGSPDPSAPPPEWVLPNYQAPEVVAGRWDGVGPAADVYAVGAVLYDALTGVPPFDAPTPDEAREWVGDRPAVPPSRLVPGVPAALDIICLKCLEKEPRRRYASAAALAADLALFLTAPGEGDATVNQSGGEAPAAAPAGAYRLRVVAGPIHVGRAYPLPRRRVMVGRSNKCDLVLPWETVSRLHFGVAWDDGLGRYVLADYTSHNGTKVNEARVHGTQPLGPGDVILVSEFALVFEPCPG